MSPVCFDLYDAKIVRFIWSIVIILELFLFRAKRDKAPKWQWNYLDIKVIVTQLSIGVFQTHQTKNTVTSETQLWLRTHTHTHAERYSHTKSLFLPKPFLAKPVC